MQEQVTHTRRSDEKILDLIRTTRNDLIKSFLIGDKLKDHLDAKLNAKPQDHPEIKSEISSLSNRRLEFMKLALQELLIAPVDLEHYRLLILDSKQNDELTTLLEIHDNLFIEDIERAIKTHLY